MADLLEREDAQVIFAEDGQQALDLLEEHGASSFDVVLMDVQMPIMDGYEATCQIREMIPVLPVIGLTAHALAEERKKCLSAGMVDHVSKPIDQELLIATIQRHVVVLSSAPYETDSGGDDELGAPPQPPVENGSSPVSADSLIDWHLLSKRFNNNSTFINKLILAVCKTYKTTPEELRHAARQQDLDALFRIAHGLKSVAGNLEASKLYEMTVQIEESARGGNDGAIQLANELAGQLELLITELEAKAFEAEEERPYA